jgi:hypothetical protein
MYNHIKRLSLSKSKLGSNNSEETTTTNFWCVTHYILTRTHQGKQKHQQSYLSQEKCYEDHLGVKRKVLKFSRPFICSGKIY